MTLLQRLLGRLRTTPVQPDGTGWDRGLTMVQRETILAVTAIFETGTLPGPDAYGTVTILNDGAGLSYGSHQCTAHSGSLEAVVRDFYAAGGALGDLDLDEVLALVASSVRMSPETVTGPVRELMGLLSEAGRGDPRMQRAQDECFARLYLEPALAYARGLGLTLPLSLLAVFDLAVHSGHGRIVTLRQRFPELPPSKGGDERAWTRALISARHAWLSGHSNPVIRRTAYRTESLLGLVAEGRWGLERPLVVRGVRLD